jgi:hypothetical protein
VECAVGAWAVIDILADIFSVLAIICAIGVGIVILLLILGVLLFSVNDRKMTP